MIPRAPFISLVLTLLAQGASAQSTALADSLYTAGLQAVESGDTARYRDDMQRAAEAMPVGHPNRPYYQYHAARANALSGRSAAAAAWLHRMLDEDIEGLMVWYAGRDAAFDRVRQSAEFKSVFAKVDTLSLTITPLRASVSLIKGAGGNSVISMGSDGSLLVDAGYEPGGRAIARAIVANGGQLPRWIILTHAHEDHVGGVPAVAAHATILAHPAAISQMEHPQEFIPGVDAPAKPIASRIVPVTETRWIPFNGDTVEIVPMPAHSGGDLLVWFHRAHVLHVGDNFLPRANPFLELGGIQGIEAYLDSMGTFLARVDADTRVVPGHGRVATLADLQAIYLKTRAAVAFVRQSKDAGMPLEEIKVKGADQGLPGAWIERAYRRLH